MDYKDRGIKMTLHSIMVFVIGFVFLFPACTEMESGVTIKEDTTHHKILNSVILFRAAVDIQDRYFQYVAGQLHGSDYVKLYACMNKLLAGKPKPGRGKEEPRFHMKKLQSCWDEIRGAGYSPWRLKSITRKYSIPDHVEIENNVFFNPLMFLPDPPGILETVTDIRLLWDWFYAAILLKDYTLLEQVVPVFFGFLRSKPDDLKIYKNLYHMSKGINAVSFYDTPSIAYFYLLDGNGDFFPPLSAREHRKLLEKKNYYDVNYFSRGGIFVNRWTLENRFYMWLAARKVEKEGDIDSAYVYLKTTFHNRVLMDVKNFSPNHQVYLYATVRLALQIHSPKMYSYVLGALDPLTKFNKQGNKKILRTQLFQLID